MKYIPADKLIAKIKRKIESIENCPFQLACFGEEKKNEGELIAYKDALSIITCLQQESKDKDVFIQKAIQWMYKTVPIDDVLSVEMIEDFKKTMMED